VRHIIFTLSLALALLGAGRPVAADCLIIDQLDKLFAVQSRLARDPNSSFFRDDIRQIRNVTSVVSNRDAVQAVKGNTLVGKGATFVRFLQNTRDLLQTASLDDPYSVAPHFTTGVRENLGDVREHLKDLRCDVTQIAVARAAVSERDFNGGSDSDERDAEDLEEVRQTLSIIAEEVFRPRTFFVVLLVTLTTMLMVPVVRRWLLMRLRQAKRRNTTYKTQYQWDDRKIAGMLLDINCYGTKLTHGLDTPPSVGDAVEIKILNDWTKGTIIWSNIHYIGVQFKKTVSIESVDEICTKTSSYTLEKQNGAPRDAA
jgi:hypothetical protein